MILRTTFLCLVCLSASHVNAAEPVAIEPDTSEQKIACDKYGDGYVYVPDTKICVKISGEVRTTFTSSNRK